MDSGASLKSEKKGSIHEVLCFLVFVILNIWFWYIHSMKETIKIRAITVSFEKKNKQKKPPTVLGIFQPPQSICTFLCLSVAVLCLSTTMA